MRERSLKTSIQPSALSI